MERPERKTLFVKHLPKCLSAEEKEEFLQHFGAVRVRSMGCTGKFKHTAFASFNSAEDAASALRRLHQLKIMDSLLVVEFARGEQKGLLPEDAPQQQVNSHVRQMSTAEKNLTELYARMNFLSPFLNVNYPICPNLRYNYPPPSPSIIANISHILMTVPQFYTQVLHLMNKMNLPPPFGPMDDYRGSHFLKETVKGGESASAAPERDEEEESELESDEEEGPRIPEYVPVKRPMPEKKGIRKKIKLAQLVPLPAAQPKTAQKPEDVFEVAEPLAKGPKKIELRLTDVTVVETPSSEEFPVGSAFGVFAPPEEVQKEKEEMEAEEVESGLSEFISMRALRENRIKDKDMRVLPVFATYVPGVPTSRLYIKNLSKQVEKKDLTYIFGRFVNWSSEEEKKMYDVRVMQEGRMKGQAFVNMPSIEQAKEALKESNGYILMGKPMVVQFARSAPPKADKSKSGDS